MDEISKILLELRAVSLDTKKGFSYASGRTGPIYCDNRLILSYPKERNKVVDAFIKLIKKNNLDSDIIAGVATGAIPWATMIADRLKKPMIYIRSVNKGHGKQNQIEGNLPEESDVLVIEDLINTGGSSTDACKAVMKKGGNVVACISIFDYGFKTASKRFEQEKIPLYSLTNLNELIKLVDEKDREVLLNWQKNQGKW